MRQLEVSGIIDGDRWLGLGDQTSAIAIHVETQKQEFMKQMSTIREEVKTHFTSGNAKFSPDIKTYLTIIKTMW